jgi:hypothetical protein
LNAQALWLQLGLHQETGLLLGLRHDNEVNPNLRVALQDQFGSTGGGSAPSWVIDCVPAAGADKTVLRRAAVAEGTTCDAAWDVHRASQWDVYPAGLFQAPDGTLYDAATGGVVLVLLLCWCCCSGVCVLR